MVLKLVNGISKLLFNIISFIFKLITSVFTFFYSKIKFLIDIMKEDQKFENYLRGLKQKKLKAIRLNDEI